MRDEKQAEQAEGKKAEGRSLEVVAEGKVCEVQQRAERLTRYTGTRRASQSLPKTMQLDLGARTSPRRHSLDGCLIVFHHSRGAR
jgi:hypothetical protein